MTHNKSTNNKHQYIKRRSYKSKIVDNLYIDECERFYILTAIISMIIITIYVSVKLIV